LWNQFSKVSLAIHAPIVIMYMNAVWFGTLDGHRVLPFPITTSSDFWMHFHNTWPYHILWMIFSWKHFFRCKSSCW
jgi:hypothetical protein